MMMDNSGERIPLQLKISFSWKNVSNPVVKFVRSLNKLKHFHNNLSFEKNIINENDDDLEQRHLKSTSLPFYKSSNKKIQLVGIDFIPPQTIRSTLEKFFHHISLNKFNPEKKFQGPLNSMGSAFNSCLQCLGKNKIHDIFSTLQKNDFLQTINNILVNINSRTSTVPLLASIATNIKGPGSSDATQQKQVSKNMSPREISQRLDGIPVYTVCNNSNEFVLVSDDDKSKSLGLFFFREEDAAALLAQVKYKKPLFGRNARVTAVSLDEVYMLQAKGVTFRFLPDPRQLKHALAEKKPAGKNEQEEKGFDGVPVFLSSNLILKIRGKPLYPIFFSKEDLESALQKAATQQQRTNPNLKLQNEIQVGCFEDVLKNMEEHDEDSVWGRVVFIPIGIDATTFLQQKESN